jgi:hypothetical protein
MKKNTVTIYFLKSTRQRANKILAGNTRLIQPTRNLRIPKLADKLRSLRTRDCLGMRFPHLPWRASYISHIAKKFKLKRWQAHSLVGETNLNLYGVSKSAV